MVIWQENYNPTLEVLLRKIIFKFQMDLLLLIAIAIVSSGNSNIFFVYLKVKKIVHLSDIINLKTVKADCNTLFYWAVKEERFRPN